jgi:hypothetical protein
VLAGLALALSGCAREPSARELGNARAFEALLSAVSLKNAPELENDAALIEQRRASGELSGASYTILREIIETARRADWNVALARAYKFRAQFGDGGAYFK